VEKEKIGFLHGYDQESFQDINIDFLAKRKIAYIASSILVGIGLFSLFTQGIPQGVDFLGEDVLTL